MSSHFSKTFTKKKLENENPAERVAPGRSSTAGPQLQQQQQQGEGPPQGGAEEVPGAAATRVSGGSRRRGQASP
jgi:hypothetical protein